MIYSEIFDAMPAPARERIYQRLFDVLSGIDRSPKFGHLSDADRRAILEILRETRAGLPDYWSPSYSGG
jgi:DNA-binding transcriptional ArsR family regulator